MEKFGVGPEFIKNKLGIGRLRRKSADQTTSDLCLQAFKVLAARVGGDLENVDCLCVVTQNGDHVLPHTSAVVHGKLGLGKSCATFDLSLGCSGYVYALSLIHSFMLTNRFQSGVIITCDPYSAILDHEDRNTELLFGDAATATWLGFDPVYSLKKGVFESFGADYRALIKEANKGLFMDGHSIFNFALRYVPLNIAKCLAQNGLEKKDVDLYVLHQASKFVIDMVTKRLGIEPTRVPFDIFEYGNTVSSSIPLVLERYLSDDAAQNVLVCGFGVGLSLASLLLRRI